MELNEINNLAWMIQKDYQYTFYLDDLPSAFATKEGGKLEVKYDSAIPVGHLDPDNEKWNFNNHVEI